MSDEKRVALRVTHSGGCPHAQNNGLVVFKGRGLDMDCCTCACLEAICDIYPVVRDILAKADMDETVPALNFPCAVKGCGTKFTLERAPSNLAPSRSSISRAIKAQSAIRTAARVNRQVPSIPDSGPFMARLPEEEVQMIFAVAEMKAYKPKQVLIEQGIVGDRLFIISSGQVEVFVPGQDGKEDTVLVSIGVGECLGEISLLTHQPSTASVRAKNDCRVMEINKPKFEQLLDDSPVLNRIFTKMMYERFKRTNKAIRDEKQAAYKGHLKSVGLSDLLQGLSQSRRTGVMLILNKDKMAKIGFANGKPVGFVLLDMQKVAENDRFEREVVDLQEPIEEGLESFYNIFTWEDGAFRFVEDAEETRGSIKIDLMSLLMEGARRMDEAKRV